MTDKTVGEEVVRYDLEQFNRYGPEMAASADGDYVLFDDHQRIVGSLSAKHAQKIRVVLDAGLQRIRQVLDNPAQVTDFKDLSAHTPMMQQYRKARQKGAVKSNS